MRYAALDNFKDSAECSVTSLWTEVDVCVQHWKSNGANALLVRWMWWNVKPLGIVNDEGLRDLLRFQEPGYGLPSRTYAANQLWLRHHVGREIL